MYRNLTKLSLGGVVAVALLAFGSTFILAPAWASHEPGHDATARSQAAENAQGIVAVDQDIDTLKLRILELEATVQALQTQITNIQLIPGPPGPAGSVGPPGPAPDLSAIQTQIDDLRALHFGKFIFVSSTWHTGNLGGIAGADDICNALAISAGLSGQYAAWLATNNDDDPESTFFKNPGPYRLLNGDIVANDWADLTDGSLAIPIDIDENGTQVSLSRVWTGVDEFGDNVGSSFHCNAWDIGTGIDQGLVGETTRTDRNWTALGGLQCDQTHRIYCVEQ